MVFHQSLSQNWKTAAVKGLSETRVRALIITADHGNDPTYKGTDHTREKVPFVAYSPSFKGSGGLPETDTFAVIGATVAENFGVEMPEGTIGTSVFNKLK